MVVALDIQSSTTTAVGGRRRDDRFVVRLEESLSARSIREREHVPLHDTTSPPVEKLATNDVPVTTVCESRVL